MKRFEDYLNDMLSATDKEGVQNVIYSAHGSYNNGDISEEQMAILARAATKIVGLVSVAGRWI